MQGVIFDKISRLGKIVEWKDSTERIASMLLEFKDLYAVEMSKSEQLSRHPPIEYEIEALRRTPIANRMQRAGVVGNLRAVDNEDVVGYHALLRYGEDFFSDNDPQILDYCFSMRTRMRARRLFISSSCGYIGLGSENILPGDTICIFLGAEVPFILREKPNGQYTLIGEAYIHGIMDGEFMETGPEVRTFDIV
jgi:hypothetical protein